MRPVLMGDMDTTTETAAIVDIISIIISIIVLIVLVVVQEATAARATTIQATALLAEIAIIREELAATAVDEVLIKRVIPPKPKSVDDR